MESSAIERLINDISKLPGLGRRSAQRIALYLLKNKDRKLLPLIHTLQESHSKILECLICGNVDMINPCNICSNNKRDNLRRDPTYNTGVDTKGGGPTQIRLFMSLIVSLVAIFCSQQTSRSMPKLRRKTSHSSNFQYTLSQ